MSACVLTLLCLVILTGSGAQLLLKLAGSGSRKFAKNLRLYIAALALMVFNSLLYIYVLRYVSLALAMPFLALMYGLVPCGGIIFFGERVRPPFWLGILFICAGIVITTLD